jgi:hypothetical protein
MLASRAVRNFSTLHGLLQLLPLQPGQLQASAFILCRQAPMDNSLSLDMLRVTNTSPSVLFNEGE